MPWRPISELTPELWQRYVVRWSSGDWGIAMWKTNRRWGPGTGSGPIFDREHPQPYFGDPGESDDYDMAMPENAPTHFIDVRPLPIDAEAKL